MAKLTEKQQRFVDEYLIDLNATQAAIRAGYSAKTADVQGSRMLGNIKVQQAIAEQMAERSKRTGINQDRVVLELAKIAFLNISDVVDTDTGEILPNASPDDLACIESVKFKQSDNQYGGSIEREVKVASKLKALEMLGKHLGMWNDKLDVNITQPIVISGEDVLED
jgi:phage terminase small subunit